MARIFNASDRTTVWKQGFYVGWEKPVFGMGYESFRWHKEILEKVKNSHIRRNGLHKWKYDTPHSLYVQLFVSGGFAGLFLWALLTAYVFALLISDLVKHRRYVNLCVALSIVSFHIYGVFQSMQYVPMIWFLIFLMFGYALTIDDGVLSDRVRRLVGVLAKVGVVLVVIGGIVYLSNFGSIGLAEKYGLAYYEKNPGSNKYFGFYNRENWPTGIFRWSGKQGMIKISGRESVVSGQKGKESDKIRRLRGIGEKGKDNKKDGWMNGGLDEKRGKVVEFDFVCSTPGVEEEPVSVTVSLDGKVVDEIVFAGKGNKKRWYYVGNGQHAFLFDVSRTWNPGKMGISADERDLGIAVSEPKFLEKMPNDGVGFFGAERVARSAERRAYGAGREGTEDRGRMTDDG